LAVRAINRTTT